MQLDTPEKSFGSPGGADRVLVDGRRDYKARGEGRTREIREEGAVVFASACLGKSRSASKSSFPCSVNRTLDEDGGGGKGTAC